MYERFTDRARKTMQLANQEAQRLNHGYIGTEHILCGIVREGSGVGATVLSNLGVSLPSIRSELEKCTPRGQSQITFGKLPLTPRAKKCLDLAAEEAITNGDNYIGSEHLLLGLLHDDTGVAVAMLTNLGIHRDQILAEVKRMLGTGSDGDSVPLIGPPDGWPRTKDGHLLKPGMTVYLNELSCHVAVIKMGPHGNFYAIYGSKLKPQNIQRDTTDFTFDPSSPITVETVLRQLVNGIQNGSVDDVKRLAALAKDALDRNQL